MKIVIEIPEELYTYIQSESYDEHLDRRFDYQIRFSVRDGVPHPKGCGRLIDGDALENEFEMLEKVTNEETLIEKAEYKKLLEYISIIKTTPTIIEAEKTER